MITVLSRITSNEISLLVSLCTPRYLLQAGSLEAKGLQGVTLNSIKNLVFHPRSSDEQVAPSLSLKKLALYCPNSGPIFHFRVLERCTKMSAAPVPRSAERRSAVSALQPLPHPTHPTAAGTRTTPSRKR